MLPAVQQRGVGVENRIERLLTDEFRFHVWCLQHGQEKHTRRLNVTFGDVVRHEMFNQTWKKDDVEG